MSFVYIAPLLDKTAFKIGKALNPAARIIQLSNFHKFDYESISVINCGDNYMAKQEEILLQDACEKRRIIFNHCGGSEYFSYDIYEKLISIAKIITDMNLYKMDKLSSLNLNPHLKNQDETSLLLYALAVKIKNKRIELNLTQVQLGKIAGVALNTIKKIESNGQVNLQSCIRILKTLHLDYISANIELDGVENRRYRASNTHLAARDSLFKCPLAPEITAL